MQEYKVRCKMEQPSDIISKAMVINSFAICIV